MQQLKMVTGVLAGAGVKGKLFKDTLGKWKEILALKNLLNDTNECHKFFVWNNTWKERLHSHLKANILSGRPSGWYELNAVKDSASRIWQWVVTYTLYMSSSIAYMCEREDTQNSFVVVNQFRDICAKDINHFGYDLYTIWVHIIWIVTGIGNKNRKRNNH